MNKHKIIIGILLTSVFSIGCATVSTQLGPPYKDMKTGKKKYDAKIVFADTGLFTPSTADTKMLECFPPVSVVAINNVTGERRVVLNDLEDEELLAESHCQAQNDIAHDATTGAAASFVAPVLNSAAIAYAGHEIGKGIGKSGDQNTNTDNSSTRQYQDNYQEQEQEIDNDNDNDFEIDIGGCN